MPVEFRCPHCQKLLRVPDNSRGKRGRCPHCKEINDIPTESQEEQQLSSAPPVPSTKPAPRPATTEPAPLDPFADLPAVPNVPGPLDRLGDLTSTPGLTPIGGPGYGGPAFGGTGGGYGGGYVAPAPRFNPYVSPGYAPSGYSASYAAPAYSSDQFDESKPLDESGRPGIPWENRRAANPLSETAKQVLLQPAYAFGSMRRTGGLGRPLGYAIFCALIGGTINLLISLVLNLVPTLLQMAIGNAPIEALGFVFVVMAINLVVGLIGVAIFGTLAAIIGAFIHSAVLHLVLMMLSGARGTFEATFRLTCYVQGTLALVNVVPCLGPLASLIMYYVVTIIGVRWTHEISIGKSAAAVVITSAIFVVLVVVPMILLVIFIATLIIGITANAFR